MTLGAQIIGVIDKNEKKKSKKSKKKVIIRIKIIQMIEIIRQKKAALSSCIEHE